MNVQSFTSFNEKVIHKGCNFLFIRHNLAATRYVRFGEYDVTDYSEHKPKESPVSSLIVHEKYNNSTHDNDIGLMRLVRDIQFDSEYIVQSFRVNINIGAVCKIKLTKTTQV